MEHISFWTDLHLHKQLCSAEYRLEYSKTCPVLTFKRYTVEHIFQSILLTSLFSHQETTGPGWSKLHHQQTRTWYWSPFLEPRVHVSLYRCLAFTDLYLQLFFCRCSVYTLYRCSGCIYKWCYLCVVLLHIVDTRVGLLCHVCLYMYIQCCSQRLPTTC